MLETYCAEIVAWMAGNVRELSPELVDALGSAIVDSGASFSYVTKSVPLSKAKPGTGFVWTADGKKRAIEEIGNAGPLKGAKRVSSFTRPLVSVSDLSSQFGGVFFDRCHVYVVSQCGNTTISTCIGKRNEAQLYTFDVQALANHEADVMTAEFESGCTRRLKGMQEQRKQ